MTVLAAIGDITRFENPKHLVSYSGLNSGLEQSGVKLRGKKITKEGRKDLRWATLAPHCVPWHRPPGQVWCSAGVVEVARRAVKSDPLWTHRFI